jgi:hypothetical protein
LLDGSPVHDALDQPNDVHGLTGLAHLGQLAVEPLILDPVAGHHLGRSDFLDNT